MQRSSLPSPRMLPPTFPEPSLFTPLPHLWRWRWFRPSPRGLITQQEIRCFDAALVFFERDQERVQRAGGEKRSFDVPRGLPVSIICSMPCSSQVKCIAGRPSWVQNSDDSIATIDQRTRHAAVHSPVAPFNSSRVRAQPVRIFDPKQFWLAHDSRATDDRGFRGSDKRL